MSEQVNELSSIQSSETEKIKVSSAEIVVHGTEDKPYYEIEYFDLSDHQYHTGYSSYNLDFVFRWREECFDIVKVNWNGTISEQVKELRESKRRVKNGEYVPILKMAERLGQAADTIEVLSAKLQAVNMERLSEDRGGWILCKVKLPEVGQEIILQDYYRNREIGRFGHNEDYQEGFYIGDWFSTANNYLAWHESPEPYHEP